MTTALIVAISGLVTAVTALIKVFKHENDPDAHK